MDYGAGWEEEEGELVEWNWEFVDWCLAQPYFFPSLKPWAMSN